MKDTYIGQAWLVLSLALVFGASLAGVEAGLKGTIEENKRSETEDQIPSLLDLVDEGGELTRDITVKKLVTADDKIAYQVRGANGENDILGWVIKGAGQGFAGRIELLIGLDAEAAKVLGIYVLDQKETPALGDRIRQEDFREQFGGMSATRHIVIGASPNCTTNEIAPLSGATISSQSVCNIVNAAVDEFTAWRKARQGIRNDRPRAGRGRDGEGN